MNLHDLDTLVGIIIGASITGMVASAGWIWLCRKSGAPVLPVADDDAPFRPVTDSDLRLVKICDGCRRYQGEDRVVAKWQHLNVMLVTCPRCAAHRANVSAGNLHPKTA